jgi:hypothetical protein
VANRLEPSFHLANDAHDWVRQHWRERRDRIVGELRGMEAGMKVLPDTPEGAEVREIIEAKATELRKQLKVVEGYLGVRG